MAEEDKKPFHFIHHDKVKEEEGVVVEKEHDRGLFDRHDYEKEEEVVEEEHHGLFHHNEKDKEDYKEEIEHHKKLEHVAETTALSAGAYALVTNLSFFKSLISTIVYTPYFVTSILLWPNKDLL